jgi:hypothetical protein
MMATSGTKHLLKSVSYDSTQRKPSFHELRCVCLPFAMKTTMQQYSGCGGMYLGRQELRELTGTPIRARQILWLIQQGWPHVVDVHGRVLVARNFHDKQMGIIDSKLARATGATTAAPLNLGAV